MIRAHLALAGTLYCSGDFEAGAANTHCAALQIWRSSGVQSPVEEVDAPASLVFATTPYSSGISETIGSCQATMAEAISLAKELNDMHGLAVAIWHAGMRLPTWSVMLRNWNPWRSESD